MFITYADFIRLTKDMSHTERGEYFHNLSDQEQIELMDSYYEGAESAHMLAQVRIIVAAEMIQTERDKPDRDEKKLLHWETMFNKLVDEFKKAGG